MVDGTGVGYNTPFYLRNRGGQEISGRLKVVAVFYWQGRRNWVVGVNMGAAYSDEGKLLMELLESSGEGLLPCGTKIVGDKLHGMKVKLLEKIESMKYEPLVCSRDTIWVRVRSEVRKRANDRTGGIRRY